MRPLLLWTLIASSFGIPPLLALRADKQHQTYLAAEEYRKAIKINPDEPDLFVGLGTKEVEVWQYADGLVDLQLGQLGSIYDKDGLEAHADALRVFGRGREAADLRLSAVWSSRDRREVRLRADAVADLRAAGKWSEAEEAWLDAYARFPVAPLIHAEGALLYADMGDLATARFHADLAAVSAVIPRRVLLALATVCFLEGDFTNAKAQIAELRSENPLSMEGILLDAEFQFATGDAQSAWKLVDGPRWKASDQPDAMALRASLLHTLGQESEAKQLIDRAMALYPHHRKVQQAFTAIGSL